MRVSLASNSLAMAVFSALGGDPPDQSRRPAHRTLRERGWRSTTWRHPHLSDSDRTPIRSPISNCVAEDGENGNVLGRGMARESAALEIVELSVDAGTMCR